MNKPSEKVYKYQQVVNFIEKELLPDLSAGDLLPDSETLCRQLNCSLITLNHALRLLSERRLIQRVRNRGSVVIARPHTLNTTKTVRVIGISLPSEWNFMQGMEFMLRRYGQWHPEIDFRFEYPPYNEWKERLLNGCCDLFFGNSQAMAALMNSDELRSCFMPLDQFKGLHFSQTDFPDKIIQYCSHFNRWRAVPLTVSPVLLLLKPEHKNLQKQLMRCDLPEFLQILEQLQQSGRPVLGFRISLNYFGTLLRAANIDAFTGKENFADQFLNKDMQKALAMFSDITTQRKLIYLGQLPYGLPSDFGLSMTLSSPIYFQANPEVQLHVAPPPGYWKKSGTPLFIEGVIPGIDCDPEIIVPILNYLQSAAVQFQLSGAAGLPARNDMRELMLSHLEPAYPGLSETFQRVLPYAQIVYCADKAAERIACEYLSGIITGLLPAASGCRQLAKKISRLTS